MTDEKKVATFVKQRNRAGDGRVYRVEPPIEHTEYDGEKFTFDHVWVSAVSGLAHETYIFGSDAEGNVLNWGELDGSFRGGTDHAQALRNAGYEVA